jgi:hypothetical protein
VIDKDSLMLSAIEETNLKDFGSDDYHQALDILITALNTEAKLNDFGQERARMSITSDLSARLKLQDYIKKNPDVLEQEIVKPVFIAGLPRTGTTALHHMLNQDKANHSLRLWEAANLVPPPEDETYTSDPRIKEHRELLEFTGLLMPDFYKTHLLDSEEPDECYQLMNRSFTSVGYSGLYHIPSYADWLYQQDLSEVYAYHKLQLQLLQHKKSGRWILKAPFHQLGIEALLQHYPDALIVDTHRSPMSFVASGCSFTEVVRKPGSDQVNPHEVGADWMAMLRAYTHTFEAARPKLELKFPGQFVDIYHDQFVKDPWSSIEAIYQAGSRVLSDEGRSNMQAWLDANPRGKHGKHEYNLEYYGISRQDVEDLFGDYIHRYQLSMGQA